MSGLKLLKQIIIFNENGRTLLCKITKKYNLF